MSSEIHSLMRPFKFLRRGILMLGACCFVALATELPAQNAADPYVVKEYPNGTKVMLS